MSVIKHVTLQKIVAHDFRYDPRIWRLTIHNSVQPGNTATFLLRTASVATKRLANRMRLAPALSNIQYSNSSHPHESDREGNFRGFLNKGSP